MPARRGRQRVWEPKIPHEGPAGERVADAALVDLSARGTVSGLVLEGLLDASGLDREPVDVAGCRFARARLLGAEVDRWRFREVEFDGCDLSGLVGAGLVLDVASVRDSRLSGCTWVDAMVRDALFADVTAKDLSLRFGRLRRVAFDGCSLVGLDLTQAELDHVTFRRCDLTAADFSGATVKQARLISCDVRDLRGVDGLRGAYVDVAALPSLAPALAATAGLRVGPVDVLEALAT